MARKMKAYLIMGVIFALLSLLGFFVYLFDRVTWRCPPSQCPIAGPMEIGVILVGLALVSLGGGLGFYKLGKGQPKSFAFDVGLRLVGTGYLTACLSALADYIGMGSHHRLPYFGPLQATGVFIGETIITIGFLMMALYQRYG